MVAKNRVATATIRFRRAANSHSVRLANAALDGRFGHSLARDQDFRSQRRCSRGFGIRFATPTLPSDLSGQRWSRSATPSSTASRSTLRSAGLC
jgi:hypothetical protein